MSEWTTIPLSSQSYQAASLPAAAQRLVNMYAEKLPEDAASPFVLLPTPGLRPWITVGDGPIRGMRAVGAKLFVVSGEEIYVVDRGGTATLIGTIEGNLDCHLIDDGVGVGVAADAVVYYATESGVVAVRNARMNGAASQDGYGIYTLDGSQRFYITANDDFSSISDIDWASADALPDNSAGCVSHRHDLWLLKKKSIEIWGDTGAAAFPFERIPGGFIERGCKASKSIAKDENRIVFLADDFAVYATNGYQLERISTGPVEELIRATADQDSASGFIAARASHVFYHLNFADLSLCYDFKEGRWHERSSFGAARWRGNHHQQFDGRDIVSDFEAGALYELDYSTHADNGVANERVFTADEVNGEGKRLIMDEVLLEAESGVGNDGAGNDTDPSMFVRCSDTGGRSWSTPREAKLGKLGEYGKTVNWTRLGAAKSRVLEFRTRASVKVAARACRARLEACG